MGSSPRNNARLFQQLGYCPGGEGMYSDVTGYDWVRYLQRLQGMIIAKGSPMHCWLDPLWNWSA